MRLQLFKQFHQLSMIYMIIIVETCKNANVFDCKKMKSKRFVDFLPNSHNIQRKNDKLFGIFGIYSFTNGMAFEIISTVFPRHSRRYYLPY